MGSRSPLAWFVALACAFALVTSVTLRPVAAADPLPPGAWIHPVEGAVARPFVAPRSRYGPGHRGVDFAAAAGTPVRAANAGTVTFAGAVAGSLHVVVTHTGGLRTSSSFLASIAVRRGQHVARGDVLGLVGGGGEDHTGVLHFGLRVGQRYVDPMLLFSPPDLTRLIRLVPVDAPAQVGFVPPTIERRALAESLHLPRGIPGVAPAEGDGGPLDAIGDALSDVATLARSLGAPARSQLELVGTGASWMWRSSLAAPIVSDSTAIAHRLLDWARSRQSCVEDPTAPPGGGGSGHIALTVAGIDSATDPATGTALALDTARLGYRKGEVVSFSYAPGGGPYQREDTTGSLSGPARALASQLRSMQRVQPGREVDLIAHSQGGVVVAEFLAHGYDPGDPTFPPIGTVVTLSSPLRGAPAATAVAGVRTTTTGRAALDGVDRLAAGALPPTSGVATEQLAEGSPLIRGIRKSPLPDQIDVTAIGAVDDVIVPADHASLPGARTVIVDPAGLSDHSSIIRDPGALDATRLALEQRGLPCVSAATGVRGAVEPVVISRAEHAAGAVGRAVGWASDALVGGGAR